MKNTFKNDLRSSEITDESVWMERRKIVKGFSALGILSTLPPVLGQNPSQDKLTSFEDITSYNNFYEFGLDKSDPARHGHKLKTDPWSISVTGAAEKTGQFDWQDTMKSLSEEERIYRLRCVEAWSMVIPWMGVSLAQWLKQFKPLSSAKYVVFETLYNPKQMPGQKRPLLNWPYREGLRMDEAMNELAFLSTGLYGKPLLPQNGAPLRLVLPWKYGFKSIKSIVRVHFQAKQPTSTWAEMAPSEYGFYANVNPDVDHPRWSQKTERRIGSGFSLFGSRIETLAFNGYGEEVAHLYKGMNLRKFY